MIRYDFRDRRDADDPVHRGKLFAKSVDVKQLVGSIPQAGILEVVKWCAVIILLSLVVHHAPSFGDDSSLAVLEAPDASCEFALDGERRAYLNFWRFALKTDLGPGRPLVDQDDLKKAKSGLIVVPTDGRSPHAHTAGLTEAFALIRENLEKDIEFQKWLAAGNFEKATMSSASAELRSNGDKVFAPYVIADVPTSLNSSQTFYYWYRAANGDAMLAIRQRHGLGYHVVNASTRQLVAERSLNLGNAGSPEVAQSRFFTENGMLSTAYDDASTHSLVLYNVLEDRKIPVPLRIPSTPDEITPVVVDGVNYIVVSSRDGFEIFEVENNKLISKQMIPIPAPLYDHQVLVTPTGTLQVWARDHKSVYLFKPLVSDKPIRTFACGDESREEWLTKMTAAIGPNGEAVAIAISQRNTKIGTAGTLHVLRTGGTAPKHIPLTLSATRQPLILLRKIVRDTGPTELLLSILQGSELRIMDPLADQPERTITRVGDEVRSMNWLDGGFLAYTERDAKDQSLTHKIVNILTLKDIREVHQFDEDDVGGEHHVQRPDGGWIYVASTYGRAYASDGYSVANLLSDGIRATDSSKAYQLHPGEYIVAVNSRIGGKVYLKLIQLTEDTRPASESKSEPLR